MDYEKKYKEALEIAQKLYQDCPNGKNDRLYHTTDLEKMFPELCESEDEKIRKDLITFLDDIWHLGKNANFDKWGKADCSAWIAWLEKQRKESPEKEFTFKALPRLLEMIEVSDRAKAYTEKLAVALDNEGYHTDAKIVRESIKIMNGEEVPMATMDEDERIRKELIFYLGDIPEYTELRNGVTNRDVLVWLEKQGESYTKRDVDDAFVDGMVCAKSELEKQGEQKPSTEVKPKFHEGDWIVDNIGVAHQIEKTVLNVTNNTFGYDIVGGGYFNDDSDVHLWTIQDAKDGDVLWHSDSASNGIFIFKEIRYDGKVLCYCDYDSEDHFCLGEHHTCCWADAKYIHPATKEQCDVLFQKMKESGYEWDDEKKELKKIEKKSQRMVSAEAKEALYDKPTDEEMKELLRTEYEKGRADTIAEMYVPTQISPEESLGVSSEKYMDIVDTLTQGGQKPAKWSLEDERVIAIINNALTESNTPPDDYDKVYDWLESLRQKIGG